MKKSIKSGKGSSGLGFSGGVFFLVFGSVWTTIMLSSGGPKLPSLFGVAIAFVGIVHIIACIKEVNKKKHLSSDDITNENDEGFFEGQSGSNISNCVDNQSSCFCPYCGISVDEKFEYCPKCGQSLP